MMPTAASPCLYRKWKAGDSPLAFLWLFCLKSVQVCSPHPQSVVTNKWNKHPVVALTVKNDLPLCGLPAYWLAWRTLWTHHQCCMRSAGRTATGSVCRPQRSISCSAKPYLALQFKASPQTTHTMAVCYCGGEVESRWACLWVWGSSSWGERLGFLGLLVLSSEKSSGHNPSKQSCLHCGNSHE